MNKRKVLIIEDDNDIREFLKEEVGVYFEVEVAADGTSGFEKARTYDADLIICDVLMPGMTGFEVTKKLKSDFATSHIPIILLTALNSPEKHLEGIEAGADAYIAKPFSIKLLLARVFRLIEQRDKLREKFSSEPGIVRAAVCSTDRDKEFADRLAVVLEQNLSRPEFSIDEFAQKGQLLGAINSKSIWEVWNYTKLDYGDRFCSGLLFWYHNCSKRQVSFRMWDWSSEPTASLYHTANSLEPLHAQFEYLKNTVSVVND